MLTDKDQTFGDDGGGIDFTNERLRPDAPDGAVAVPQLVPFGARPVLTDIAVARPVGDGITIGAPPPPESAKVVPAAPIAPVLQAAPAAGTTTRTNVEVRDYTFVVLAWVLVIGVAYLIYKSGRDMERAE